MIVSMTLTGPVADAVALEAARAGLPVPAWLERRLADHFGLRSASHASGAPIISEPNLERRP